MSSSMSGVLVSNVRFVVPKRTGAMAPNQTTYAMSGVTSVKFFQVRPNYMLTIVLCLAIFASSLCVVGGMFGREGGGGAFAVAVVITALVGFFHARYSGPSGINRVILTTSGGEIQALEDDRDRAFIERVVKALNEAIRFRG